MAVLKSNKRCSECKREALWFSYGFNDDRATCACDAPLEVTPEGETARPVKIWGINWQPGMGDKTLEDYPGGEELVEQNKARFRNGR